MTTIEGNKLIAEFMGVKIGEDSYMWRVGAAVPLHENHLAYHKEWGWLMPVVEKIEEIEIMSENKNLIRYCVKIENGHCIICDQTIMENKIADIHLDYDEKLKAVWLAVTSFIQWYNSQNLINSPLK